MHPFSLSSSCPLLVLRFSVNVYSLKLYISLHCFPTFHPTTHRPTHIHLVVVYNYATGSVLYIAYWEFPDLFLGRITPLELHFFRLTLLEDRRDTHPFKYQLNRPHRIIFYLGSLSTPGYSSGFRLDLKCLVRSGFGQGYNNMNSIW